VLDLARLAAARSRQALGGYWAGESVTLGYALALDPAESARRKRPTYRRVPSPLHADVVGRMLRELVEQRGNPFRAARALGRAGVIVPEFGPDVAPLMASRSMLRVTRTRVNGGWRITPWMIAAAARNPAYAGARLWAGEVVGHDPSLALVEPGLRPRRAGPRLRGRRDRPRRRPPPHGPHGAVGRRPGGPARAAPRRPALARGRRLAGARRRV
jgi:hypothetical protein